MLTMRQRFDRPVGRLLYAIPATFLLYFADRVAVGQKGNIHLWFHIAMAGVFAILWAVALFGRLADLSANRLVFALYLLAFVMGAFVVWSRPNITGRIIIALLLIQLPLLLLPSRQIEKH